MPFEQEPAEEPQLAPPGRRFVFVGRDEQLSRVTQVLGTRPAVVLVEGQAGIGKSRLVAEAAEVLRAQGIRVLLGICHPLREPMPYGPVIDALRPVGLGLERPGHLERSAGGLTTALPALAPLLPEPPSPTDSPATRRHRLLAAVRAVLTAVAPVVLVVEDVHWADDATRGLLMSLARDMQPDTGLVLTYRREDLPSPGMPFGAPFRHQPGTTGADVVLTPLLAEDLRTMARDALGSPPPSALARTLMERSGGLPLVLEEDLVALSATKPTRTGSPALHLRHLSGLGLPRSLREVMAARLSRLGAGARAVVRAAAVLGVSAREELLVRAAGLGEAEGNRGLTEALGAAVLQELLPGEYGFGPTVARQAVYEALPGPIRTRTHRRALTVLREQDPAPLVQIAHHTRAVGDSAGWQAIAREAADQAANCGDHGTATALLRELVAQPGLDSRTLGDAALQLAAVSCVCIDHEATLACLRKVLAAPGLPTVVRGEIRSRIGLLRLNQGRDTGGEEDIAISVSELQDNPVLAARALAAMAVCETDRLSAGEEHLLLERAHALLESVEPHPPAAAAVESAAVVKLAARGRAAALPRLAALARGETDPDLLHVRAAALANCAEAWICTGQDGQAAAVLDEVLTLAGHARLPILTIYGHAHRLLLHWAAGRWHAFEDGLERLAAEYPDSPLPTTGLLRTATGTIAAARGRSAEAAPPLLTRHRPGRTRPQLARCARRHHAPPPGLRRHRSSPAHPDRARRRLGVPGAQGCMDLCVGPPARDRRGVSAIRGPHRSGSPAPSPPGSAHGTRGARRPGRKRAVPRPVGPWPQPGPCPDALRGGSCPLAGHRPSLLRRPRLRTRSGHPDRARSGRCAHRHR
ncbi:AAA family ATPase [Kitasatospora sp. NPDC048365]|uniref:ATP-binding protein n=1 Tax=Kitasatospora sp. NPDC048365 TaxID=3364050 RepID=UPI003718655B